MFSWMAWTQPVAIFFTVVALLIVAMTVWELRSPTVLRKGWLPIATTRGDRLFIGLMVMAWINLAFIGLGEKLMTWLSLEQEPATWWSFGASLLVLALLMRKG